MINIITDPSLSSLISVKYLKKLCIIVSINIWKNLRASIHFSLLLGKVVLPPMHALISITESIHQSTDNDEFGCGIFIDLKKAFDTVNHRILLTKLNHYGIRGNALEWFESYLSHRQKCVCLNGHTSISRPVICGVPQGSILAHPLFLLYVNDLSNSSSLLIFHVFADDTNLYLSSRSLNQLKVTLNQKLKSVADCMKCNRLVLSISKTNLILFHLNKLKPDQSFCI